MENLSFHYESGANASFFVVTLPSEFEPIQYQQKMLENNEISHLLDVRSYRQDGDLLFCYNVTGKISLEQVLARKKMSKDQFLTLLDGVLDCCLDLQGYQLPASGLCLQEETIFLKSGNYTPSLVYLPVKTTDNGLDELRNFTMRLLMDSRLENTKDDFVQKLLNLLNQRELTATEMRNRLKTLRGVSSPVQPSKGGESKPEWLPPAPEKDPIPEKTKPSKPKEAPSVDEPPIDNPASEHRSISVNLPKLKSEKTPVRNNLQRKQTSQKKMNGKAGTSKELLIFIIVQVAFALLLALAVKQGFFMSEDGSVNGTYILGFLILVAGADFVLYRELFINKKAKGKGQGKRADKKRGTDTSERKAKPALSRPVRQQAEASIPAEEVPAPLPKKEKKQSEVKQGHPGHSGGYYDSREEQQLVFSPLSSSGKHSEREAEDDDTDTDLMDGADEYSEAILEYYENGLVKRIRLQEDPIRVGSKLESVDYVLPSRKVSKVHAEFVSQNGNIYVRDINSTNGTYINGGNRIVSNQWVQLHPGDQIKLANIEMMVR